VNILQLTLAFPPAYAWGGPVKTVHLSCRELVRRGHRVTVYCSNLLDKYNRLFPETIERELDGIRVVYFKAWNIPAWPGTLGPVWLPELSSRLAREIADFDVIHINGYRNLMHLPAGRLARKAGVPYVVQPHGSMPVILNSFRVKRLYDRFLGRRELRGLSALVALQESERRQALVHGVPNDRIEIIPNGVDLDNPMPPPEPGTFRKRHGIAENRPLVLFLARINRKKGTDMLVEAFAKIDPALNAALVIAGPDDGQLAEVRRLIDHFHLKDRVILPGLLSHEEAMAALRDADLFVLPCRTDTFPMAIIEACMMETPMVITDRCEIADIVKDRVADIVPFDAAAFGAAMERLLVDGAHSERYRVACSILLRDAFSLGSVVDRVEALYRRVIAENPKR
jgi:glycosyltransferase involved in cell wall biosynthesis